MANLKAGKLTGKPQRMPIFFQQPPGGGLQLAIWEITEEAPYFLDRGVPPGPATHPQKALQHLAGRYLLQHLVPRFPLPLIRIADSRKPFLEGAGFDFSVSHWGRFAGALIGEGLRVGLDLEGVGEKVDRIRGKFVSPDDEAVLRPLGLGGSASAALVWSGKEALFKWYGLGGVDFRRDLRLLAVGRQDGALTCSYEVGFKSYAGRLEVTSRFIGPLCVSWLATLRQ